MINIYKEIVRNYVNHMSIEDLEKAALKLNLPYNREELLEVYQFIKYHYIDLLDQNIKIFEELKEKINPTLYKELISLYIDYKQKYLSN